jgi:hypothetical protein
MSGRRKDCLELIGHQKTALFNYLDQLIRERQLHIQLLALDHRERVKVLPNWWPVLFVWLRPIHFVS